MKPSRLSIDCSELTVDEELALAASVSESLNGKVLALVDGPKVVLDRFGEAPVGNEDIEAAVTAFITRRKDHEFYSIESVGDALVVHSADPVRAPKRRPTERLPPNLMKCPFCSFVTPYEELYIAHTRSHGFVM